MYGAILGDMIGAPYEFDRGDKTKDFPLFSRGTQFTDDSVMTIAVAEALMDAAGRTDDEVKAALIASMQKWGKAYPDAGYGGMFRGWLTKKNPKPYGSFGNGSAMRVAAAGWLYDTMVETRRYARISAEVTHNHPEGIKGAEATAAAIFMARTGSSKEDIKAYITEEFGYELSRTCDEIRPYYHHVETCQETVPEAITAFLEGESFEDVIRTAVSLGGDCDTLTCIAGGIAEAFYGVPKELIAECRKRLPEDMLEVIDRFQEYRSVAARPFHDSFLDGNEVIEQAIDRYHADSSKENLIRVMDSIRSRMHADGDAEYSVPDNEITAELLEGGAFLKRATEICNRNRTELNMIKLLRILRDSWVWVPCNAIMSDADYEKLTKVIDEAAEKDELDSIVGMELSNEDNIRMVPDILQNGEDYFFPVFTSAEEMGEYGERFSKMERHFLECMALARNNEKNVAGIVINAFSEPFIIPKELFNLIADMKSSLEVQDED